MSTGKVLLGAIAGLATGAVLGILFAPDKGSVTRKKIMDQGNDYADNLKSKYKEFANSVTENLQNVKQEAQEFADKGRTKFNEMKKDASNTATNL